MLSSLLMMTPRKRFKTTFFLFLFLAAATSASAETMTSSISELILAGQSVACSYEKTHEQGLQKGTFYVAGERVRGDMTVTDPTTREMPMHMLREGDWMYTWGDAMGGQGMKMKASQRAPGGPSSAPDVDEEMVMDCRPWPVDESKFVVPTDVQFMDMGGMMGLAGGMPQGDMSSSPCSACEFAPPEERQACLQALNCA